MKRWRLWTVVLLVMPSAAHAAQEPPAAPAPQHGVVEDPADVPATAALPPAPVLTPAQETRARRIEGELRCPVCRSQSIRQSRSFLAEDMRRRLHTMVAAGASDAAIRAHFTARYGEWIFLTPPRRGFSLTAWLLPASALAAGALGIALFARRWTPRGPVDAAVPVPQPSPYLARLERELEETR
ncbi:MAG: cytochrome c-type biogenesis protein CcmH [Gemmatimonadota bacterium]